MPTTSNSESDTTGPCSRGLQEERVERDAWIGILDALTRLKEARESEKEVESSGMTE